MDLLQPGFDLELFFCKLATAPARLLLLDYDGTLAPFQVERGHARPYPGVVPLIERIMVADCRVVVISGRSSSIVLIRLCTVP